ncbi:MAG: SDR family oxidoreductase [Chloroflexi bacterium]|nr:SDR family oxidoreductase [Chloroflexota bacterium]
MRLADKVAIVTGAGRGNGRGIARGLAREGAAVAVADIIEENARKVARGIEDSGGRAIALKVDVTDPQSVQGMVDATLAAFSTITTLVNDAGVISRIPFFETTKEEFQRVVDVNLTGTFLVAQAVARVMVKAGGGSIINIASQGAERGAYELVTYCASKGGVKTFTMALAVTLGQYNIRVNAIAPGPIPTDMTAASLGDPVRRASIEAGIPLGRLGTPEDLAGICVYYASDESSWVTGSTMWIDGGGLAGLARAPIARK